MANDDFTDTAAAGELLKDSPLRRVMRLTPRDGAAPFVVKSYRVRGVVERVRALWLRSRARVEQRNLERARQRGLPCPAPLDCRIPKRLLPDEGWLVLEDLGRGRSLDRVVAAPDSGTARVLERAGRLVGQALARGLDQRDWHLGNLYLDEAGGLHLLDLHAARFVRSGIAPAASALRGLYLSIPWPDQAPLRAALMRPLGLPANPAELATWLRRHVDTRIGRCLRDSGSFVQHERDGRPWIARRFFAGDPDQWLAEIAAGRTLKAGRRGRVVRCASGIAKLRDEARALELWRAAEALELRRVPHANALALFPDATDPARWWVLSAEVEGVGLDAASDPLGLAIDLGASFARLHGLGWRCRDARGDNFVARGGRVVFVDLDGVRPSWARRRNAAQAGDLARLRAWLRFQAGPELRAIEARLTRGFAAAYARGLRGLGRPAGDAALLEHAIETRVVLWRKRHMTT